MHKLILILGMLVNQAMSAISQNPHFFDILNNSECLNMEEVLKATGWTDASVNPYTTNPTGVDIDRERQCYALVQNPRADFEETKMKYVLKDLTAQQASVYNRTSGGHAYLTHNYTCGACSSLADLAVYLQTPDLTTPVKSCTIKTLLHPFLSNKAAFEMTSECIAKNVGFSEMCSNIWVYNTQNTRKNCEVNCVIQEEILRVPNNVPKQRAYGIADTNYCDPSICAQKINGQPACDNFQW